MDVDNGEEVVDEDIIESKLIGSPLFCVHLEKLYNQGMVECLAEKSVRIRRELHPFIISFIHQEEENEEFALFGEKIYFHRIQKEWNYLSCTSQLQFFW